VNRRLKGRFSIAGVVHVSDVNLHTLKNGELLRAANESFDVLVTIDKNMPFQSSLKGLQLAVAVLNAKNNSIDELSKFVARVEREVEGLKPGTFNLIELDLT